MRNGDGARGRPVPTPPYRGVVGTGHPVVNKGESRMFGHHFIYTILPLYVFGAVAFPVVVAYLNKETR